MFFYIEGYGGCSNCPEYSELVNKKGEAIFLTYHDTEKEYHSIGDLASALNLAGINEQNFSQGKFLTKRIEPI